MSLSRGSAEVFATVPDPGGADSVDDLVERLRRLKVWAGDPSYETIKDRVNAAWTAAGRPANALARRTTVADCFAGGRRRLNADLVLAVVRALHPDAGYVDRWRRALRVVGGQTEAVAQVRVQDSLPPDPAGFAGRGGEIERLWPALKAGETVVISAIEGMAGVGKTQLAVHLAHRMMREKTFERVLFVNLRGFHADPGRPPADPAAVLQGFLRLLGVPGQQIPEGLAALAGAYRDRVATVPTLVILDNAATAEQVRPLLPEAPGCLALVTSRRSLADLLPATRVVVDVFRPAEAVAFLERELPGVAVGADPEAAGRIARRCGYLPLALSLVTGHIRNRPGWTLTDHADRLDDRHRQHRLDTDVEAALDLSYRHLPGDQQRLLRLAALHPAQDLDRYAAAALTGTEPETAGAWLTALSADHVLQPAGPGRYTFHDLVRAYAVTHVQDDDRPAERQAALTRLFDYYLATAATAMDVLFPGEAHRRPRIEAIGPSGPDLSDPDDARAWLHTERPALVAVIAHTAVHGRPRHATRLARTLTYYLTEFPAEALTVYGHSYDAALLNEDPAEQAAALKTLGAVQISLGRLAPAAESLERAIGLYRQLGDPVGECRALSNLGFVATQAGRYPEAIDHQRRALALARSSGDTYGESHALTSLGAATEQAGRYAESIEYCLEALTLARRGGDLSAVAWALSAVGENEVRLGRYEAAVEHLEEARTLHRQSGWRQGEAGVLDAFGTMDARQGRFDRAIDYYRQAAAILREAGDRYAECGVLNSLGETTLAAGRPHDALAHHSDACAIATEIGAGSRQAGAHAGLGDTHVALGDPARAREHYGQALAIYTELGLPEADEIRLRLTKAS